MTKRNFDTEESEVRDLTEEVRRELYSEQFSERKPHLKTIMAGITAMLIGALLGAYITVVVGHQIAYMAIFEGFIVALAIRVVGNGKNYYFGLLGAALTILGCTLGHYLAQIGILAREGYMEFFEAMQHVNIGLAFRLIILSFNPLDFLFFGVAFYVGYRFAIKF